MCEIQYPITILVLAGIYGASLQIQEEGFWNQTWYAFSGFVKSPFLNSQGPRGRTKRSGVSLKSFHRDSAKVNPSSHTLELICL